MRRQLAGFAADRICTPPATDLNDQPCVVEWLQASCSAVPDTMSMHRPLFCAWICTVDVVGTVPAGASTTEPASAGGAPTSAAASGGAASGKDPASGAVASGDPGPPASTPASGDTVTALKAQSWLVCARQVHWSTVAPSDPEAFATSAQRVLLRLTSS